MDWNWFNQAANYERKRIFDLLHETQPGTAEYRELQRLLGGYEIIDEKRRQGKIQPIDAMKWLGTATITVAALTADMWIPALGGKLKIVEFGLKLFK